MAQLTIDGRVSIADRIEEAAKLYSADGSIGTEEMLGFAKFCRREGYLDHLSAEASQAAGDKQYIRDVIFKANDGNGRHRWVCTGETAGRWVPRRFATKEQRILNLRLLLKKRNECDKELQIELQLFNAEFEENYTEDDLLS